MTWLSIAIIGPILWSIQNHLDKYLLSRISGGDDHHGPESLTIFSGLFGIVVAGIIFIFNQSALDISLQSIVILVFSGLLATLWVLLYLRSLDIDETSIVAPFFQIIPVFGYIFGALILKEQLQLDQIFSSIIILLGASILSVEFDRESGFRLKKKVAIMMLFSTAIIAFSEVLFKFSSEVESFWVSTIWLNIGMFLGGMILLSRVKYRRDFVEMMRKNKVKLFAFNCLGESITGLGNIAFSYATLIAPIALVMVVNSYQPLFVFAIGIILTFLFPKMVEEDLKLKTLIHRFAAIGIMIIGSYMLYY